MTNLIVKLTTDSNGTIVRRQINPVQMLMELLMPIRNSIPHPTTFSVNNKKSNEKFTSATVFGFIAQSVNSLNGTIFDKKNRLEDKIISG